MSLDPKPLISTIIPTFRRPELLRRAIRSALSQTFPSLQVCVYDNASGDETADVVAEMASTDPRLRYFCHASNIGGMANFQYGLSHISTPFFTFLSDDDVQLPGFFESAMDGFEKFPDAMFWAGLTIRMSSEGRVYDAHIEDWPREGFFAVPEGLLELLRGKPPCWTGVMFRRQVIDQIGLLDPDVHAPSDFDYLLRIAARNAFAISKHPVAVYMLNTESFSEQGPFSAFWPGWLKMIDNVCACESLPEDVRQRVRHELNNGARRLLFRRGASALANGRYEFSQQAATILREHYFSFLRSALLQGLSTLCASSSSARMIYGALYSHAINLSLNRRSDLQLRYGSFSTFLEQDESSAHMDSNKFNNTSAT
ncbi:MAG: hypothetical protein JWR07_4819 [Nevskia sp.]|nr:hypothetical protein [Nevskia sp.]